MSSKRIAENIDGKTAPETTSSDRELIISRIIDAPRERTKRWAFTKAGASAPTSL